MFDQAQLEQHLERLLAGDGSEAEEDALIARISANVLDPRWMDHVYHSNTFERPDGTVDLAALSAHILSYEAIRL